MSAALPLLNLASTATDLSATAGADAAQASLAGGKAAKGVGHRLHALAAKAGQAGQAAAAAADASQAGAAATAPQTFADLLNRVTAPLQKTTMAQAGVPGPSAAVAAQVADASKASAAASSSGAVATAADAVAQNAGKGVARHIAQGAAANAASSSASGGASNSPGGKGASSTQATDAAAPVNDPTGPLSPLAGLAALLFSGPLQTPLATSQASTQAQKIQTTLANAAKTASPDQLASWKSALAKMGQALNASEKQATGVDPAAPPAGWTEPANFQAARSLLNALQGTISDAQAAKGIALPAVQSPHSASQNATASTLQAAFKQKFNAPAPQGQATAKLLGETAAPASGGGASKAAGAASAAVSAQGQGQTQSQTANPAATVRTAAAQTPAPTAQKPASAPQSTPPSARDVQLSSDTQPTADKTVATAPAKIAAPAFASKTPVAAQPPTVEKQLAAAAEASQAPAQPGADEAALATADAAGSAQAASAASAATPGAATTAQAADPTRVSPQAVAYLASSIVNKANGKSSSFSIELHPADLGRVEVKLQIEQDGRLAARMSFDNPAAAADFQARSDDLRRSLEQAGFQLSGDALSFSGRDAQTAGGGSGGSAGQGGSGQSGPGGGQLADAQINSSAADAAAASSQNRQAVGLDMRI